ncbi:LytR/AlgR family response regulator transcription factor [Prolixibacter denitrificans]|uniref:DNA-binding LytR/AlgR family response regulator n=1 Tax=Prolixibacter denitrificans TaxID=1541063 RepID=A0A2P8C6X5_9BACT|nr:LytTR family DNA-binding domain-containing protein [Prolixibacter denitrificans]PSK80720.1 DNA-binding LytR/AlgR family response regulator [Prolixibacter denitrificans]GET22480.1 DNA-binding response regulator [Prolixibacter denitrificans]
MNLRVIAIDDEPLALQLIKGYIQKTPFLELVNTFDNPLDAMEFLAHEQVDLLFLDIHMPDLSGTEFTRTLTSPPKIIFTTAYEKYALEGFKLNAVDYLLKPFSYEEFLKAAIKAQNMFNLEHQAHTQIEANNEYLFIKSEYKIRRINFDNILYIEGLKDYIKVHAQNEAKPILSLNSLKALDAKLPEDRFMRVHRSYIVNLAKIETIERNRIVFGKVYIPVGDQYKEKFQEFLDKNFL